MLEQITPGHFSSPQKMAWARGYLISCTPFTLRACVNAILIKFVQPRNGGRTLGMR